MSEKDSHVAYISSEYVDKDVLIPFPENHILIWLDFGTAEFWSTSRFTYASLWEKVNVSVKRFTEWNACYSYVLILREREEKLFIIITDPIKPLVQKDLFILWGRLLFESHVTKIYIIQTKIDITFYRYWLNFKQQQGIFFIPNETLLLEQLNQNRNANTVVICLETGTSEIFDITKYQFNELFSDATECFNYIISNRHREMILVINSQNSNVFTYRIALRELFSTQYYTYMFSKLSSVYILTSTRTKQIGIKRTDIFANFGLFQKQLEKDTSPNSPHLCNNEVIYCSPRETLQMSLRSVTTERFFDYINIIARSPQKLDARREMIQECQERYKNDPRELEKIDQFVDEYYERKIGTAIWWYSHDSFLYRLLNEACRTEDIDLIYTFRNFISDILEQLQQEHTQFCDDMGGVPLTVYRGQCLSLTELNHLRKNLGRLFSTNTFLSATGDFMVARIFAQKDDRSNLESVIFEYNIDTTVTTNRPYADIRLFSSKRQEEEVMFCMGTIFQVESIEQKEIEDGDNKTIYWYIVMKHVSEHDHLALVLESTKLSERYRTQPILLTLGQLAQQKSSISSDYSKAERYFRLHLDEILTVDEKIDYKKLVTAYEYLATLCYRKGDYAANIEYNEHIITTFSTYSPSLLNMKECERMNKIVHAYSNIARTCSYYTEDYDSAIKAYNNLLEYLQTCDNLSLDRTTSALNGLGNIYKVQGRWFEASECYERAYSLNRNNIYYNTTHVDIAREKLYEIGSRYSEILFFALLIIWCYSYSFDIFNVDQIITKEIMSLSFIRLINYYIIQRATMELSERNQKRVELLNTVMNKILKRIRNTRLHRNKQRLFTYLYKFIPSFIFIWTRPWPIFTDRKTLKKGAFGFILGTILLAVYLPIIFVLITRIVMIWFVVIWLSDLNTIYWLFLIVFYHCFPSQILSLLFNFMILLLFELQFIVRQKRRILNTMHVG